MSEQWQPRIGRVPRDVVRGCPVSVLVMPDETPSHHALALEPAMLAPKAEMTFYSIPLAVRHVRTFLKANRPA